MEEIQKAFHLSPAGLIEAPAGFGKTYLILDTISKFSGEKQLVLTHTVAGVSVLRSRVLKHGMTAQDVSIETIAGWCQKFVLSFPGIAKADLEILRLQDPSIYWDHLYETFINLLENTNIKDIIRYSYGGLYVDEYQDCTQIQHKLLVELSKLLPVRVLGDPLQGIFNFRPGQMVSWPQVQKAYTTIGTLSVPYRWKIAGNLVYGEWLKQSRANLLSGKGIDLTRAPECVNVILLTGKPGIDQAEILKQARQALPSGDRRLIIGDKYNQVSKSLVVKLSRPRYRLIESIYSNDIKELRECLVYLDKEGRDNGLSLFWLLCKYYSGVPQNIKLAAKKIASFQTSASKSPVVKALSLLKQSFSVDTAFELISSIEDIEGVSCHRTQPVLILESTFSGVKEERHSTLYESLEATVASMGRRGRIVPRYGIGSTLLVKGLEVDEVIVLDAQVLGTNDLYVALSRATKKITIFTDNTLLAPTK